jgi:hypothetical protein
MPLAGAFQADVAVFHVAMFWMRSSPRVTFSVFVSIVHLDTKAPIAPCAREVPTVLVNSWLASSVNVLWSSFSNAPSPSGIPTRRYGVPSGLVSTESPTVRIDLIATPGEVGTRYGGCELDGPVDVAGPAIATAVLRRRRRRQRVRCALFSLNPLGFL